MSLNAKSKEPLKPVYLITGSDETKVEKAMRRLKQRVIRDSGTDLNIDVFDAREQMAPEVIQAASTLPFGDGPRLVLVMHAGAWGKADKDAVSVFLTAPPHGSVLALIGSGIKRNEALFKAVDAVGEVLAFEAPRHAGLARWTRDQARGLGLKLGQSEARRLVFLCGSDQRSILSELEKLSARTGSDPVGMDEIDSLCWSSPETRIWDLTDALGAGDRRAAFRQLEALLDAHAEPAAVFYSITRHVRTLAQVAEAAGRGEDPVQTALDLGQKPFPARKLAQQRLNFSLSQLREATSILAGLDADLKGRNDMRPDLALETAVARIMDLMAPLRSSAQGR